ncbi:MAG TPA: hypothetical protein PK256_14660 [Verrucomicrobiota bacterium]|nr:hypothetical protein [Verrucomicrobiota bacterium]
MESTDLRPSPLFPATQWITVLEAKGHLDGALAALCGAYREPLLIYLRSRGHTHDEASDLVQGFFADLLERDFLRAVSPEKGRFRTFLLRSLQYYLCDQFDRRKAQRRGGGQAPISLSERGWDGSRTLEAIDQHATPDLEYDRAWAHAVLARAFEQLEKESVIGGKAKLFAALKGTLQQDPEAARYQDIARDLGLTEGGVRAAAKRVRDRLGYWIRVEVQRTLGEGEDWRSELKYLIGLFGN